MHSQALRGEGPWLSRHVLCDLCVLCGEWSLFVGPERPFTTESTETTEAGAYSTFSRPKYMTEGFRRENAIAFTSFCWLCCIVSEPEAAS